MIQKKCSEWESNPRPLKCVDTLKLFEALHRKWGFLLRNSSINVTKSTMIHQFGILYISLIIVNIVRYCFSSTLLWTSFNLYYALSLPHQNKEILRMCSTNEVVKVSKFGYHKKTLRSIKIVFAVVVVVVVVFSGFFGFSCSLAPL